MKIGSNATRFIRGQLVEVRSAREIAGTLDAEGKLDGVPFMPEMVQYCGSRARVFRRANKTCVEGHGIRSMKETVLLVDLRCDGAQHDGCQRNCLFFWKEAWLKRTTDVADSQKPGTSNDGDVSDLIGRLATMIGDRYYCQSTELYGATSSLSRWSLGQFFEEMRFGELSIPTFMQIMFRTVVHRFFRFEEVGSLVGTQRKGSRVDLGLQAGEWVDVKQTEEIRATLDSARKSLGLEFVPVMSEYIGGRYQVDFPVKKIILEQTGKMVGLNNTVALKGVNCQGVCVKNCPRNSSLYWRESWLQRVDAKPTT